MSNPVTGELMVQRIEEQSASEVEEAQKKVWAQAESNIQAEFRRRNISLSAFESLQALRRFDVNITAKPMTVKIMENLWEALDGIRVQVPQDELPILATFLKDEYFTAKKAESSKRVLLTHVNAALRCFRRRYVNSWQSFYGEDFKLEEFLIDLEKLRDWVIESPEDLLTWANEVSKLSNRYGVDRKNQLRSSRESRPVARPLGIISPTSEGPYNRQWTAWINGRAEQLLGIESSGFNQAPRADAFIYSSDNKPLVSLEFKKQASSKGKVTVKVTSLQDESVKVTTEWPDLVQAENGLSAWMDLLGTMWGAKAADARISLSVNTPEMKFDADLPPASLKILEKSVSEVLAKISKK